MRSFRSWKVFVALAKSAIVSTVSVAAITSPPIVSASSGRMRIVVIRCYSGGGWRSHASRGRRAASIGVAVGADLADVDARALKLHAVVEDGAEAEAAIAAAVLEIEHHRPAGRQHVVTEQALLPVAAAPTFVA